MGNRAVLQFRHKCEYTSGVEELPSIYVHWNGGRASIEAFLNVARELHLRNDSYGVARLCQIIGNFFGGNCSLGVKKEAFDPGDNSIFVIEDFKIVDRLETFNGEIKKYTGEEENDEEKTKCLTDFIVDMMGRIDVLRETMNQEEKYK